MSSSISSGQASLNTRPHALYRFYDRSDVLLYVGITVDIPARVKKHRAEKPWWTEVSNISIENFGSRHEVLAAERTAIRTERPLYNIDHNLMVAAAGDGQCPAGCGQWGLGRQELAAGIIDYLGEAPGSNRFNEANGWAREDSAEADEDDRRFTGDNELESTVFALASLVSDELRSYEVCANMLVRDLPPDALRILNDRVLRQFRYAGEPEPSYQESLRHIVSQAGRFIAELMGEA